MGVRQFRERGAANQPLMGNPLLVAARGVGVPLSPGPHLGVPVGDPITAGHSPRSTLLPLRPTACPVVLSFTYAVPHPNPPGQGLGTCCQGPPSHPPDRGSRLPAVSPVRPTSHQLATGSLPFSSGACSGLGAQFLSARDAELPLAHRRTPGDSVGPAGAWSRAYNLLPLAGSHTATCLRPRRRFMIPPDPRGIGHGATRVPTCVFGGAVDLHLCGPVRGLSTLGIPG